jgi:hypothetical protein
MNFHYSNKDTEAFCYGDATRNRDPIFDALGNALGVAGTICVAFAHEEFSDYCMTREGWISFFESNILKFEAKRNKENSRKVDEVINITREAIRVLKM